MINLSHVLQLAAEVTPQELYDELVALDSKITIEDVRALVHGANFGGHQNAQIVGDSLG